MWAPRQPRESRHTWAAWKFRNSRQSEPTEYWFGSFNLCPGHHTVCDFYGSLLANRSGEKARSAGFPTELLDFRRFRNFRRFETIFKRIEGFVRTNLTFWFLEKSSGETFWRKLVTIWMNLFLALRKVINFIFRSRFYAKLTRTTFKELSFRMRQSTGTFPARWSTNI